MLELGEEARTRVKEEELPLGIGTLGLAGALEGEEEEEEEACLGLGTLALGGTTIVAVTPLEW